MLDAAKFGHSFGLNVMYMCVVNSLFDVRTAQTTSILSTPMSARLPRKLKTPDPLFKSGFKKNAVGFCRSYRKNVIGKPIEYMVAAWLADYKRDHTLPKNLFRKQ